MPPSPTRTADSGLRALAAAIAILSVTGVIALGVRMSMDRAPAVVVGVPDDDGEWRIAAYSLTVDRTLDNETTTTTAELDS